MHLLWATRERRPLLNKAAAAGLSAHLTNYATEKEIYMKINFVNPDHVHALVDLPTSLSIEEMMQLLKRRLLTLGKPNRIGFGEIWVGAWLRDILRLSLRRRRGGEVHRRAGGASSQAELCRRVEIVCGTIRAEVA